MATILNEQQSAQIGRLNREFGKKFPGWMCEGSDLSGEPCNAIFNNDTDEWFLGSYDGEIIKTYVNKTPYEKLKEMAEIQGKISRIAEA